MMNKCINTAHYQHTQVLAEHVQNHNVPLLYEMPTNHYATSE